jgi:hypothetical protein
MTPEEQERMHYLCEFIAKEQDQKKFVKLVQELNDLLDHETQRLDVPARTRPRTTPPQAQGVSQSTE